MALVRRAKGVTKEQQRRLIARGLGRTVKKKKVVKEVPLAKPAPQPETKKITAGSVGLTGEDIAKMVKEGEVTTQKIEARAIEKAQRRTTQQQQIAKQELIKQGVDPRTAQRLATGEVRPKEQLYMVDGELALGKTAQIVAAYKQQERQKALQKLEAETFKPTILEKQIAAQQKREREFYKKFEPAERFISKITLGEGKPIEERGVVGGITQTVVEGFTIAPIKAGGAVVSAVEKYFLAAKALDADTPLKLAGDIAARKPETITTIKRIGEETLRAGKETTKIFDPRTKEGKVTLGSAAIFALIPGIAGPKAPKTARPVKVAKGQTRLPEFFKTTGELTGKGRRTPKTRGGKPTVPATDFSFTRVRVTEKGLTQYIQEGSKAPREIKVPITIQKTKGQALEQYPRTQVDPLLKDLASSKKLQKSKFIRKLEQNLAREAKEIYKAQALEQYRIIQVDPLLRDLASSKNPRIQVDPLLSGLAREAKGIFPGKKAQARLKSPLLEKAVRITRGARRITSKTRTRVFAPIVSGTGVAGTQVSQIAQQPTVSPISPVGLTPAVSSQVGIQPIVKTEVSPTTSPIITPTTAVAVGIVTGQAAKQLLKFPSITETGFRSAKTRQRPPAKPSIDITEGGGIISSRRFGITKKEKKKYTPSLVATTFNITGKVPIGKLTGLEFRPVKK